MKQELCWNVAVCFYLSRDQLILAGTFPRELLPGAVQHLVLGTEKQFPSLEARAPLLCVTTSSWRWNIQLQISCE